MVICPLSVYGLFLLFPQLLRQDPLREMSPPAPGQRLRRRFPPAPGQRSRRRFSSGTWAAAPPKISSADSGASPGYRIILLKGSLQLVAAGRIFSVGRIDCHEHALAAALPLEDELMVRDHHIVVRAVGTVRRSPGARGSAGG